MNLQKSRLSLGMCIDTEYLFFFAWPTRTAFTLLQSELYSQDPFLTCLFALSLSPYMRYIYLTQSTWIWIEDEYSYTNSSTWVQWTLCSVIWANEKIISVKTLRLSIWRSSTWWCQSISIMSVVWCRNLQEPSSDKKMMTGASNLHFLNS